MSDDFCRQLLDETRHEIDRADTKASILLAAAGVVAAVFVAALVSGGLDPTRARGLVQVAGGAAAALVVAGVTLLGAAVYPRIHRATVGRARYFMDIAQYNSVAELRSAVATEQADVDGRNLQQLFDLSKIVRRKYRCTRWGELLTAAGLLSAGLAGILHLAMKP